MKKEKIYNYFYIVNNLKNGHFYLGIHSTNKLADGYMGSGDLIKRAIKLHGKENFEITPLKFFGTRKELLAFEKEIVNERFLKYYKGICYNLKKGGEGGKERIRTEEEKKEADRKCSLICNKNRWANDPDFRQQGKEQATEWRKNNPERSREISKKGQNNFKTKHPERYKEIQKQAHARLAAKKKAEKLAAQQGIII